MISRVRANLKRQVAPTRAVIVENGSAVGACKAAGWEPDVLLQSGTHQSLARNAALDYLQSEHPGAYWVSMDDDDWYSPYYVEEHLSLAERGKLVGKTTHWVLFEEKALCLFRPWQQNGSAKGLNGATLGCYVADAPRFGMKGVGEDTDFCYRFLGKGGRVWSSSAHHAVYCRRDAKDHTFAQEAAGFLCSGPCMVYPPDELHRVSGDTPASGGVLRKFPEVPEVLGHSFPATHYCYG